MFKITAILLMLAGSFFSCAKRGETGGEVPYNPCPCDEGNSMKETELTIEYPLTEAYLFRDSIPKNFTPEIKYPDDDGSRPIYFWVYSIVIDSDIIKRCITTNVRINIYSNAALKPSVIYICVKPILKQG